MKLSKEEEPRVGQVQGYLPLFPQKAKPKRNWNTQKVVQTKCPNAKIYIYILKTKL